MMSTREIDIGLTHIALPVSNVDRSVEFYAQYAGMQVVHRRIDAATGIAVVWLSDHTRPFVIVLIQIASVHPILSPLAHLGIGCESRESMDALCDQARQAGVLLQEPKDSGYPIGYWAFLRDPDGHTLELSYGQEIGLTYWGKGYASEAAREALRIGFEVLKFDEIVSFTAIHNQRSRSVMERLKMREMPETFLHPNLPQGHPLSEHCLYKLLRSEFKR